MISAAFFMVYRAHNPHSHGVDVDGLVATGARKFAGSIACSFKLSLFLNPTIDFLNGCIKLGCNCLGGTALSMVDSG